MPDFHVADLRDGYVAVVRHLIRHGKRTAPRGIPTREVLDKVIVVERPYDVLPVGVGRLLNPAIAAVEALQLIGGFSDPALTCRVAPNMRQFRDAGVFHGAYGPRVRPQLPVVLERLKRDPSTRQAVIVLWDPLHDLFVDDSRDYPCTTFLQFLIRDDRLLLHVSMRSNDVWWGLAYDAFQFTQLQLTVAFLLGIEPGEYRHHAVSLHLYERDLDSAARLHRSQKLARPAGLPYGFCKGGVRDLAALQTRARSIAAGEPPEDMSINEQWYFDTLKEHLGDR